MGEVRSAGGTQVVKKAYAKFVVSAQAPLVLGEDALDVRENSPGFLMDGTSSIKNSILAGNGAAMAGAQIKGGVESMVEFIDAGQMLVNVRYEANPDPRPMVGASAIQIGAGAVPPSDGILDAIRQCIGAFCNGENWLEEWTLFGDEFDYEVIQ